MAVSEEAYKRVIRLLEGCDGLTKEEIAKQLGWSPKYVRGITSRLHKDRKIHVTDWKRDEEGHHCIVWGYGDFPDESKPRGVSYVSAPTSVKSVLQGLAALELTPFRTAMWNVERAAR